MGGYLGRLLRAGIDNSPRENLAALRERLKMLSARLRPSGVHEGENQLLDGLWAMPGIERLVAHRLRSARSLVLLGGAVDAARVAAALRSRGVDVSIHAWSWDALPDPALLPDGTWLLLDTPASENQWNQVSRLRELHPDTMVFTELAMPIALLQWAGSRLPYILADARERTDYYLGEKYFGPIDALDRLFPLAGKSVIEFGPLDAYQTAGLVQAGAAKVACVEARPDNMLKTLVARQVLGWDNVELVMDDFHNACGSRLGRYDLAFAHGVYYHSIAPFLFLENLVSLAPAIFIGGFCATDDMPSGPYEILEHQGRRYRAKKYVEHSAFTAGVNRIGYFFQGEDLLRFFAERGFEVTIMDDERCDGPAGRYLRFLARKAASGPA